MDAIPSILSSAQTALSAGFSKLNEAAAKIASATSASDTTSGYPGEDPFVGGIVDTFQAQEEVGAGAALLNTYQTMTNDLMEMSDSVPRYRHVDLYA